MQKNSLPKGFISIEDACELIKSDTRSDAKVDTAWLVAHVDWIEVAHNFRIPLMKHENGGTIRTGSKYVQINTAYDRELLSKTIRDHYRDMVGQEYNAPKTRSVSTVADEEVSGGQVAPRISKPIAKEGATINGGETITTNGENL